ncbi:MULTISPECIES: hypothetical protein [Photorhabdus]|uniref:Uncharacterized protein n=1 Tax=Photorhabdus khanii TaxID=1004150 RepID=A0A7C9KRX4_9GAMM|nr:MULTISPECIES: hypothetical protein [Photorhabdus]MQL47267.1 hypothetical protein [Photorhabdus khanii]MQL47277.1 hypothetical protein [Photorhabdus khanii]NHB63719.1 hypothetical protein [Photorhabdus sp. RW14-46]
MRSARGDTTVRINEERKLELKRKIIEIGNKTGEIIKSSELVNRLIDNYLDEVAKDIIGDVQKQKNRDSK